MLVVGRALTISLHGTIKRTQTLSMSNVLGQVRYSLKVFIIFFQLQRLYLRNNKFNWLIRSDTIQ